MCIEKRIQSVVFVNGKHSFWELEHDYQKQRRILVGKVGIFPVFLRLETRVRNGLYYVQLVDDNEWGSTQYGRVIFQTEELGMSTVYPLRPRLLWAFDRVDWMKSSFKTLQELGYVADTSWSLSRDSGQYWMEFSIDEGRISLHLVNKGHQSGAIMEDRPLADGDVLNPVVQFEKQWMTADSLTHMNERLRYEIATRDLPLIGFDWVMDPGTMVT